MRVFVFEKDAAARRAFVSVKRVAAWGDAEIFYEQASTAHDAIPMLMARCSDYLVIGADESNDHVTVAWVARAQSHKTVIIIRGAKNARVLPPGTYVVAASVAPVGLLGAMSALTPSPSQAVALPNSGDLQAAVQILRKRQGKLPKTVEELTTMWVVEVVRECGGNKTHAAALLGVDRNRIYECLRRSEQK